MTDPLHQLRGHRAGLRAAIGQVESSLASPAPGRAAAWSRDLREQLEGLSGALDQHVIITEGPEGLLADIMAVAPRLADRVDVARQDHGRLREQLDAVTASLPVDDAGVAGVREQVVALLIGLVRHRQAGADLVYEAYNIDIESAD